MKIISTFDELNEKINAHTFTLIYVSSENCSVCKADHPIVQKMAENYQIPAYEIVANQVPEAVGQLNLFTSPVVMLFYNQKEVHRQARIIDFDELQYRIEQINNL
ncbi:thioredoxin family protein [Mammaliicoccus fleurettii]|uniref:thioredoxin family protein n=1 Tax=Mammaliicoccus fleurettii TaxID=150056 RepID=UPI00099309B7|nr:thioredoxin family protein [Mammaliicoccus fleurettii]OOV75664.1 thiol reductase thioredoxin [Mammaliicoccus fleurettii]